MKRRLLGIFFALVTCAAFSSCATRSPASRGSAPLDARVFPVSARGARVGAGSSTSNADQSGRTSPVPSARGTDSTGQGTRTRTFVVHAPYTDPTSSQFDGAQCRGIAASAPDCRVAFVGEATFAGGNIIASEYYDLTGGPTSDGKLYYEGPTYLTGTIVGCGTGTFIMDEYGGYIDFAAYNPQDNFEDGVGGSAPGFNYWRIRPGSGTGGLSGLISGEGVNYWRDYIAGDAGLIEPEGIGLFTGKVTCRA